MFNFFRRKSPSPPEPDKHFMSALELSDGALINLLCNMFKQQHVSFSSLFLVGYANWSVQYNTFLYALRRTLKRESGQIALRMLRDSSECWR